MKKVAYIDARGRTATLFWPLPQKEVESLMEQKERADAYSAQLSDELVAELVQSLDELSEFSDDFRVGLLSGFLAAMQVLGQCYEDSNWSYDDSWDFMLYVAHMMARKFPTREDEFRAVILPDSSSALN